MSHPVPSILLVDDDVDICANMADILGDLGYDVDVAHEGTTALELLRRRPDDVALPDFRMPGMDGVALCREIQRVRSGVVPMLITAYAGAETARDALSAGAWRVLAKPVDFGRLLGLVDEAIGQPLVLVVDDDPDLCDSLRDVLRAEGFRVCVAHDEAGAIGRLRETTRVVLLDLRLPGGDGASVFRRVRSANPAARVAVHDNGPGLGPLPPERVFEPFFTTKTKGTGLGLAIVRRVVEAHGGRIESGSPGGAEFVLTVPRDQPVS